MMRARRRASRWRCRLPPRGSFVIIAARGGVRLGRALLSRWLSGPPLRAHVALRSALRHKTSAELSPRYVSPSSVPHAAARGLRASGM